MGKVIDLDDIPDEAFWCRDALVEALMDAPTSEPEIVRCKDCLIHGICRFEQGLGLDGFCSQAERRTDDQSKR